MIKPLLFAIGAVTAVACGGAPPSPEVPPAPAPGEPPAETHTMPDGTTMPGGHHDEGSPPAAPTTAPSPPKTR